MQTGLRAVVSRLKGLVPLPRHVALDLRGRELYWVESGWTPGGQRVRRRGCECPAEGEDVAALLRRVTGSLALAGAEISIAVRHPDLRVERLDLPLLSDRDARRVASRRLEELAQGMFDAASAGFVLAPGKRPRPAWLLACPEEFTGVAARQWSLQGVEVSCFAALPVALGALARLLPAPADGELRAFVDFGAASATCVVTDADGWVFSRETSLKVTGDIGSTDAESGAEAPIERIATELRRTFHYVRTELSAGSVTELVISGERPELAELAGELAPRLELPVHLIGDASPEGPTAGIEPGFGAALGIALYAGLGGGNLLPKSARCAREKQRARQRLAFAAGLSALVLLLGAAYVGTTLTSLRERASRLEEQWRAALTSRARAEADAEARASATAIDEALASLATPQPSWPAALESLGLLLPDDALVERLSAQPQGDGWRARLVLEFRGEDLASAAAAVSRFTEDLGASPFWRVRSVERDTERAPLPDDALVRIHFRVDADVAAQVVSPPQDSVQKDAGDVHG